MAIFPIEMISRTRGDISNTTLKPMGKNHVLLASMCIFSSHFLFVGASLIKMRSKHTCRIHGVNRRWTAGKL